MKKIGLKALCLMMTLCSTLMTWGADFVVDGIKYSVNNGSVNAMVIANTEKYSGDIVIPATVENQGQTYNVTAIGRSAFNGCTDMTSITLNEGIETLGDYALKDCSKLKTLVLPNSVTQIGWNLCEGCNLLESVVIGDGLKAISWKAFCNLGSLESVTFGKKVEEIGEEAFRGCAYLKDVELPASLKTIYPGAFYQCQSFVNVTIPASVRTIGKNAFNGCTDMASITFNEGIETLGDYALKDCSKLKTLVLPNSVTQIGWNLCEGCNLLESVVIGDGLKAISWKAFCDLGSLKTVTLGKKVDMIGENSFAGCKNINTIMCTNTKPAAWYNQNSFAGEIYPTCTLYVPEGSGDTYKVADGWKNFYNIKEGEPTGINSAASDESIKVYAAEGAIIIKGTAAVPFSIYNVNGSLEVSGNIAAGENRVPVDTKGIYIVKIAASKAFKIRL